MYETKFITLYTSLFMTLIIIECKEDTQKEALQQKKLKQINKYYANVCQ